jgi:hypothetical protein
MSVIEGNLVARAKGWLPEAGVIALLVLSVLVLPEFALLAAAGIIALLALPMAPWLLPVFFGVACGLPILVNEHPVQIAGIKFYGADAILYFLPAAVLRVVIWPEETIGKLSRESRTLLIIFAIYFVWGLVSVLIGLGVKGYPVNEVLGAFRRLYLYPGALVVCLVLLVGRRESHWFKAALWLSIFLVFATASYRLGTGQTYHERQYVLEATIPSPRLLSVAECTALCMALAYATAVAQCKTSTSFIRLVGAAVALGSAALLAMSGFRLAALFALVVPSCAVFAMIWLQGLKVGHIVGAVLTMAVITGVTGYTFVYIFPEIMGHAHLQFMQRLYSFRLTDDMRYYIWRAALGEYASSPVFGTGLGSKLTYPLRASDGQFWMRKSTTHSTLLTLLYQTGPLGIGLFIALHGYFLRFVLLRGRQMTPRLRPLLLGVLAFYAGYLAFSMLQPTQPTVIFCAYSAMGLCVYLLDSRNDTVSTSPR